ncbi:hypothetical protein ACFE04_018051 [Oxalis oulophora]
MDPPKNDEIKIDDSSDGGTNDYVLIDGVDKKDQHSKDLGKVIKASASYKVAESSEKVESIEKGESSKAAAVNEEEFIVGDQTDSDSESDGNEETDSLENLCDGDDDDDDDELQLARSKLNMQKKVRKDSDIDGLLEATSLKKNNEAGSKTDLDFVDEAGSEDNYESDVEPPDIHTASTSTPTQNKIARKTAARKTPSQKASTSRASTSRASASKAPSRRKPPASKASARKAPTSKETTTKAPASKATSTKAPASKATTSKAPTTKAPASKTTGEDSITEREGKGGQQGEGKMEMNGKWDTQQIKWHYVLLDESISDPDEYCLTLSFTIVYFIPDDMAFWWIIPEKEPASTNTLLFKYNPNGINSSKNANLFWRKNPSFFETDSVFEHDINKVSIKYGLKRQRIVFCHTSSF